MTIKNLRIAIDVDETLVSLLSNWNEWMKSVWEFELGKDLIPQNYYLSNEVNDFLSRERGVHNADVSAFWQYSNLYDDVHIDNEIVEVVQQLYKHNEVFFVSACYPEHENSKRAMLRRHFGNIEFISTSDKHRTRYDVLIDDNPDVLNGASTYNQKATHFQMRHFLDGSMERFWKTDRDLFLPRQEHNIHIVRNWQEFL